MKINIPTVKLSDCCQIISGSTPKTSVEKNWGGNILWATPKDLSQLTGKRISDTSQKITESGYSSCSTTLLPPRSVLFSSRAPIGLVAINEPEMCTNQGFKSFIPDTGQVFADYLYYWLRGNREYLQSLGNGATFKEVSKKIISQVKIPLPPLKEQKRIAKILDQADSLREKRRQAIAKLDELLQSVFLDMFGDPVTNPKGWDKYLLKNCILGKPSNGYFAKNDHYGTGTPIIWIGDFIDRFYCSSRNLKKVNATPSDISKFKVDYGDALFCRSSLNVEGIGKVSIVPKLSIDTPLMFECHVIKLSLNMDIIVPEYFRVLSDSRYFRHQVMKNAKTSTMTTIAQDGIIKIELPVPPLETQKKFTNVVQKFLKYKEALHTQQNSMNTLFSSLQQKAFKGEL
jgi:type I restriction enzyme, S subunit